MERLRNDDAAACALAGMLAVLVAIEARTRERAREPERTSPRALAVDPRANAGASDGSPGAAEATSFADLKFRSARELRALPGIGELRANAIVRARHAGEIGGSLASLDRVPGIGEATIDALERHLGRAEPQRLDPGRDDAGRAGLGRDEAGREGLGQDAGGEEDSP